MSYGRLDGYLNCGTTIEAPDDMTKAKSARNRELHLGETARVTSQCCS